MGLIQLQINFDGLKNTLHSSPNISEAPMDKGFQGSKELMKSGKEL